MATQSISALDFKPSLIGMGICWLLLGTDAWLIDSVLDPIRSELKKQHGVDIVHIYGDEIKADHVQLIDFHNVEKNQFLVVNQFTIQGSKQLRRPDLIDFADLTSVEREFAFDIIEKHQKPHESEQDDASGEAVS